MIAICNGQIDIDNLDKLKKMFFGMNIDYTTQITSIGHRLYNTYEF